MLNFDRSVRTPTPKETPKQGLKPALYEPPSAGVAAGAAPAPARLGPTPGTPAPASPAGRETPKDTPGMASAAPVPGEPGESRLSIGPKIKLKGVEISDCDVLVIEGHVEATVFSKTMDIAEPGTLQGTALIDVAEVRGEFTGELTARTRLVVHGTGRVAGTIRYGKLVVEEGGELCGDVQRISERDAQGRAAGAPGTTTVPSAELRLGLLPQTNSTN